MQREGSPFRGMAVVALKEAADHLTSARVHLVMLLVILTAIGAIYGAIGEIKQTIGQDRFIFLRLFTTARDPLPSFVSFLGFLLPLVAIALGFDGINGEYNRRTMSRILAQPIYRDALLAGKFVGGHRRPGNLPGHALAADDRRGHPAARPAARRRGDRPRSRLSSLLARLCQRLAGGRAPLLDALPLAGDIGARCADALAALLDLLEHVDAACRRRARRPWIRWIR